MLEKELRQSEKIFKFLTENTDELVLTLDRNFQTDYVSPSIRKVLGFTPEERKLQSLEEMVTPESLERMQAKFLEELERDKEPSADSDRSVKIEIAYYHKDGSVNIPAPNSAMVSVRNAQSDIIRTISYTTNEFRPDSG